MPIYEYACTSCDTRFEELRPVSAMDGDAPCPECSSRSRRRLSVFASFSTGSDGETRATSGCGGCGPTGCACSTAG